MIISMYRIAVTNRHLCREDFLTRIRRLAEGTEYDAILLREKDMTEREYRVLAGEVLAICKANHKKCILHTFYRAAVECGHPLVHLPLPVLREMPERYRTFFVETGTSVHSMEQAQEAVRLGVSYMTAGHIFPTQCKPGLPARGLVFLKEICDNVPVPVYGIGGISKENESCVVENGGSGVCIMSGCMKNSVEK